LDRGRPFASLLRGLALASLASAGVRASAPVPIREADWIVAPQRLHLLTTRPEECLPEDSPDIVSLVYGTVAFRDPMLLGGQAARAGLSCMSCHRGGRGNPGFHFPGLSGAPGTADVTSSLMSSHRGDGIANPRPIPDLTFDVPKISRVDQRRLEAFIRGLIVEEFDGEPPSPVILKGLANYVRALDPAHCPSRHDQPYGVANALADYFLALGAAETALVDEDRDTALAMLRGARSILGSMDARYQGDGLEEARSALEEAGLALAQIQQDLRDGKALSGPAEAVHRRWAATRRWADPLIKGEPLSLYNPRKLRAALAG